MLLRLVRVRIAEGKTAEYWAWASEMLALWDEQGVRRAGGPYAARDAEGRDIALWLTVHEREDEVREEFRLLYAEGRGKALIERRPPLVAETVSNIYREWNAGVTVEPPSW